MGRDDTRRKVIWVGVGGPMPLSPLSSCLWPLLLSLLPSALTTLSITAATRF
jgi:hypothetical protein